MASVEWTTGGLRSLADHDAWRVSQGWEPISLELFDAVETYFQRQSPGQAPRFLPGRRVHVQGADSGLRMVTVRVRSKLFRVHFAYLPDRQVFQIRRILHPRAR